MALICLSLTQKSDYGAFCSNMLPASLMAAHRSLGVASLSSLRIKAAVEVKALLKTAPLIIGGLIATGTLQMELYPN